MSASACLVSVCPRCASSMTWGRMQILPVVLHRATAAPALESGLGPVHLQTVGEEMNSRHQQEADKKKKKGECSRIQSSRS